MIVIPAIDLLEGRAVRLAAGVRERATVYSDRPRALVERFVAAGARRLHVVDLDGAFAGIPVQRQLVAELSRAAHDLGAEVQCGGGIRTAEAARSVLEVDTDFVVIGTLAVRDPIAVEELCRRYPGRVIVAVDARDGVVAVDGWREASGTSAAELGRRAEDWGAAAILFTDVSRDGLQVGPAVAATAQLQSTLTIPVFASGGVGALDDLDALRSAGIRGVVLGRALYEGTFTVEEALAGR